VTLYQPELDDVPVLAVLQALADESRLSMVRQLADGTERLCGTLAPELSKATRSHHLKVLREAGVTATRRGGDRAVRAAADRGAAAALPRSVEVAHRPRPHGIVRPGSTPPEEAGR